ncbi:TonB-dependent receptor [Cellvibrio sp. NN19]|uniref:TonB-dependent receptor n=1 Tax=Cellvibrio chitinivorans TaxID=3102792 RepID=UPI002B412A29|nr:TonB-dependent receptor [Cellvibrio sp. NN19]
MINRHTLSRTHRLKPLALACAVLPLLGAPMLVQAAPAVEEVTVTAAKREQNLQDFTGAISVLTDFSSINNIGDIAAQVPGFSIVDAGPRNPTGLIIRGLRTDSVGDNDLGGDGSTVASYVDNIPLQGYFVPPSFNLKDLQQVEVVRGPQGTLYGNASNGGLIRYVTAKPDLEKQSVRVSGKLSQTDHSDDLNYDTDLVVNTPLIDNTLGLRFLLGKTDNAGFIDNPYLISGAQDDINDDETKQARISLLWQASDNFSLNTMYDYQKVNVGDRQAANESFTGDEYTASSRILQPMQGELQLASIDAEYEMGWATLTASLNHYDYQYGDRRDQTDYFIFLDNYYGAYYTLYEDMYGVVAANVDVVKDSAELRLASADDQRLRWLVGGFYSRDDMGLIYKETVPGFGAFIGEDRPGDIDYDATQDETLNEISTYAELIYDLTENWEASIGARYFRYEDKLETCSALYPYERGCENGDDDTNDTLGKFSTTYRFSNDHKAYFIVGEGYRRGGANITESAVASEHFYAPDRSTNYELGFNSYWLNQRLQLNVALFTIDWENIQFSTTSEDGRGIKGNAGDAQSQGIELDATAKLSDAFTLRLGYSDIDAELTESVEELGVYDGDRLPGSPSTQWSLSLDFNQEFNGAVWDASIGFNRIGDVTTALNEDFYEYRVLDAYTTANARAGVTLGNWRVGAFVNNIENTRGITGARTDLYYGDQGKFDYITRPRTIGMSVVYQY